MRLSLRLRQSFRTITPEDYLFNQREAVCAQSTQTAILKPLQCANQGDIDLIDEVKLLGVTRKTQIARQIPFHQNMPQRFKNRKFQGHDDVQLLSCTGLDLMYLQLDPSDYVARQRFMSHKCALGKVEDYRLDGIELIDPHKPITWEETVVNLFSMDMMLSNTLPSKTTYKNGLYAYSYTFVQDDPEENNKALTPLFIDAISTHVLGGKRSEFPLVDKFLYTGLMARHKVMLGGMPETLFKMILGKSLSIHELRDIFRIVLLKNKELTTPFTTKAAAQNFMPHIFLLPKDLYMTALLKEAFQAATQVVCAVGMEHWRPIQEYWVGPPHGINYTEATRIPEGFAGESVEDLIQKQAILDVLLETRTWSKPYLSSPFPYLLADVSKVDKGELDHYKQVFLQQYRKYSEFKNREVKMLEAAPETPLLSNLQREQLQKMAEQFKEGHKLSHLRQKMDIKLDKGFFSSFK